jgi:hypothetical protein
MKIVAEDEVVEEVAEAVEAAEAEGRDGPPQHQQKPHIPG